MKRIAILTILIVTVVFAVSAIAVNLVYPVDEISEDVVSEDEATEDDVSESEVSEDDILGDDDEIIPVDKISEAAKQWQRKNLSRFSDPYYYYDYIDDDQRFSLEAYTDIDLSVTWSDVGERCGDIVITPNDELGVIMFEFRLHCVQPEDDTDLPPELDDGDYYISSFDFAFMREDESSKDFAHSIPAEVRNPSIFLDMYLAERHIYMSREVLMTVDELIQYLMEVGNEDISTATETMPVVAA